MNFLKERSVEALGKIAESELLERLGQEERAFCILNNGNGYRKFMTDWKGMEFFIFRLICIQSIEKEYLQNIRERLGKGKRCIVVATSLVEAG